MRELELGDVEAAVLGGSVLAGGGGGWAFHGREIGEVALRCNEYMTVEAGGERLATFPDLITTLALDTGLPVSAAQATVGAQVALLVAPKAGLPLGAGMRDPTVYPEVEAMIGKDLATYALAAAGA